MKITTSKLQKNDIIVSDNKNEIDLKYPIEVSFISDNTIHFTNDVIYACTIDITWNVIRWKIFPLLKIADINNFKLVVYGFPNNLWRWRITKYNQEIAISKQTFNDDKKAMEDCIKEYLK